MFRVTWGLWVASCALMACGGGAGTDLDPTDQLPELQFSREVDFGAVPVGLRVTETLQLFNQGTETVTARLEPVSGFSENGFTFDAEPFELEFQIGPGNPTPIEFGFLAEQDVTSATAVARLVLPDTGESADIALTASTAVALAVEPTELAFGATTVGWPNQATLTIRNLLQRSVPVFVETNNGKATPTVLEGLGRFDIDAAVSGGRLARASPLEPGESVELDVSYAPDPQGPNRDRATWQIGACGNFDLCGITIPFSGVPIDEVITCTSDGAPIGGDVGIVIGNLNPPETYSQAVTCAVREDLILDNVLGPLPTQSGIRIEIDVEDGSLLEAGSSFDFVVDFEPESVPPGTDTDDVIEVQIRDPRNSSALPGISIPIQAGHGRPALTFDRERLDFQTVRLGTTRPDRLVVTNSGPVPFTGRLSLSPELTSVSAQDAGRELFLDANETRAYPIEFTPTNSGSISGTATFESTTDRDPDLVFELPIEGEAENLPPCSLEQSTDTLDMGRSASGVDNRAFVVLTNTGNNQCVVNGIRFAPGSSSQIGLVQPDLGSQLRLAPGENLLLELSHRTPFSGTTVQTAELDFYTSGDPSARSVSISASRSTAPILMAPHQVDFRGGVDACGRYEVELDILNGASQFTVLQNLEVTGPDAQFFEVTTPFNLPIGVSGRPGALPVQVSFLPQGDSALRSAQLELTLNDATAPFVVPLLGSVEPSGRVTSSFVQSPHPRTDVYFVLPVHLDEGGQDYAAMMDLLSLNYGAFIAPLQQAGIDYRIGFITGRIDTWCGSAGLPLGPFDPMRHDGRCGYLSVGYANTFQSNWRSIEPGDLPSPEEIWSIQTDRDPEFNRFDRLLFSAYLSAHPDVRDWNAEMFREDSTRHYVFVSNQDDGDFLPPEQIAPLLRHATGYPGRNDTGVTLITGPRDMSCTNQATIREATDGNRFHRAADVMGGGPRQSVCESDWGRLLEGAAEGALGIRRFHRLDRTPDPATVEVSVDGIQLGTAGFAVDADAQTVELIEPSALVPGAEIDIVYRPRCAQ